jgi:Helix-turn-helix domain
MLQNDIETLEERAQTPKRAARRRRRKLKLSERLAVSPAEFSALVGRSPTYGYRLIYAGLLKPIRGYGRLLIPRSEIDRFLNGGGGS